jgi:hypothetical protein
MLFDVAGRSSKVWLLTVSWLMPLVLNMIITYRTLTGHIMSIHVRVQWDTRLQTILFIQLGMLGLITQSLPGSYWNIMVRIPHQNCPSSSGSPLTIPQFSLQWSTPIFATKSTHYSKEMLSQKSPHQSNTIPSYNKSWLMSLRKISQQPNHNLSSSKMYEMSYFWYIVSQPHEIPIPIPVPIIWSKWGLDRSFYNVFLSCHVKIPWFLVKSLFFLLNPISFS